jgi:hypothetical protein
MGNSNSRSNNRNERKHRDSVDIPDIQQRFHDADIKRLQREIEELTRKIQELDHRDADHEKKLREMQEQYNRVLDTLDEHGVHLKNAKHQFDIIPTPTGHPSDAMLNAWYKTWLQMVANLAIQRAPRRKPETLPGNMPAARVWQPQDRFLAYANDALYIRYFLAMCGFAYSLDSLDPHTFNLTVMTDMYRGKKNDLESQYGTERSPILQQQYLWTIRMLLWAFENLSMQTVPPNKFDISHPLTEFDKKKIKEEFDKATNSNKYYQKTLARATQSSMTAKRQISEYYATQIRQRLVDAGYDQSDVQLLLLVIGYTEGLGLFTRQLNVKKLMGLYNKYKIKHDSDPTENDYTIRAYQQKLLSQTLAGVTECFNISVVLGRIDCHAHAHETPHSNR